MAEQSDIYYLLYKSSYIEGDFITRAGKKTNYYIDKYQFETRPDILDLLSDELVQRMPDATAYDAIVVPALGAVSLGAMLAFKLNKPTIVAYRKGDKQKFSFYGDTTTVKRVVLLEDILTSGTTCMEVYDMLVRFPMIVVKIIAVIDREEGAKELFSQEKVLIESIVTAKTLQSFQV